MGFNLPRITAFLCCNSIQQDVMTKNYDLRGVFQGFAPPGYPLGVEFMTFTRLFFENSAEFQIDISLYDEKGEKVSDSQPRKLVFAEAQHHDLITAWRLLIPSAGKYDFKIFCNNLNLGEYRLFCR